MNFEQGTLSFTVFKWRRFIALMVLLAATTVASSSDCASQTVRRGYVDSQYGQLHYVMARPLSEIRENSTLVMIHQTVNSSIESVTLFEDLAKDRVVIGIDTPGFGNSDGPTSPPTVKDYAATIAQGLADLGYGPSRQVDIAGFHTGALIAAEVAIGEPKMIRRVALSGVYFVDEARATRALNSLPQYKTSAEYFEWAMKNIPRRQESAMTRGVPDAVWGQIMVESLRPLTRSEFHHVAAFSYAPQVRTRMPLVVQPVLLLALGDGLRQPTIDSLSLFPNATLVDLPQYLDGAYFPDPEPMSSAFRRFLDQ
jgi:pimeloyl-ACP methyl ester carboxylesterase